MVTPTGLDLLAQNNFGDTRTGGLTGPLGLLIIVLLAIATVFLIRSMNKRLRRLPDSFPPPAAGPAKPEKGGEEKVLDPTDPAAEAEAREESGSTPKN
ncbi:hypothetical protein [Catenuloplanes indicus]|uniref:Uncharacterized protein n=1 Tax=Catenuloplanes indicus TaxID=137267 RepID=A0AAE4AXF9_9ACTN|nr:hypothetical protein [Catenuloplanes indicus]MDQ0366975.1 hypothetical protein [Catenuloplanes indicus]